MIYDWGGGLIWVAMPPQAGCAGGAGARARCRRRRSCHAAARPDKVRRQVDVFQPASAGAGGLERAGQAKLRSEKHSQSRPDDRSRRSRGPDMKTEFSLAQLADPDIAEADKILRDCVHCGFCTATCPTYVLLGDELDSPRGTNLFHQGDAGKGPPADSGSGQAHRPLPFLPFLHDHLSVGCELHASGRSGAGEDRAEFTRPMAERRCARCWRLVLPRPGTIPRQHDTGAACAAVGGLLPSGEGLRDADFTGADQGDAGAVAARPAAGGSIGGSVFPAEANGAGGSRYCRGARSRCWRRGSTRLPSAC